MLLVQVPVPLRSWLGEEGERALRTEEESAGGRAMGKAKAMPWDVEDDDDVAGGGRRVDVRWDRLTGSIVRRFRLLGLRSFGTGRASRLVSQSKPAGLSRYHH
jgi:hypothetical protein